MTNTDLDTQIVEQLELVMKTAAVNRLPLLADLETLLVEADGDTREAVTKELTRLARMEQAGGGGRVAMGIPKAAKDSTQFSTWLPRGLVAQIRARAWRDKVTIQKVVERALLKAFPEYVALSTASTQLANRLLTGSDLPNAAPTAVIEDDCLKNGQKKAFPYYSSSFSSEEGEESEEGEKQEEEEEKQEGLVLNGEKLKEGLLQLAAREVQRKVMGKG